MSTGIRVNRVHFVPRQSVCGEGWRSSIRNCAMGQIKRLAWDWTPGDRRKILEDRVVYVQCPGAIG